MVATPKISNSKLSPIKSIRKYSLMTKLSSFNKLELDDLPSSTMVAATKKEDSKILTFFSVGSHQNVDPDSELNDFELNPDSPDSNDSKCVNVKKKDRNIFKNINSIEPSSKTKNKDEDLPIQEGIETFKKKEEEE